MGLYGPNPLAKASIDQWLETEAAMAAHSPNKRGLKRRQALDQQLVEATMATRPARATLLAAAAQSS